MTVSLRAVHQGTSRRLGCRVADIQAALSPDDADWLDEVLESPDSTSSIKRTIEQNTEHRLSHATLTRHRDRDCPCWRGR